MTDIDRCAAHTDVIDAWRTRADALGVSLSAQTSAQALIVADIKSDLRLLCERVPNDLKTEFAKVQSKLDNLHSEFSLLRTQAYWVIGSFVMAFIIGLTTFIIRGGLK